MTNILSPLVAAFPASPCSPTSTTTTSLSSSSSAMKSYKRLFLPTRVRSNSITTLAVVPSPTSTSRPVRLPSEGPKQLALTQPTPGLVPPLFPCTPPLNQNTTPVKISGASTASTSETPRAPKRQRLRYQLDVGAYGIPKHRRGHSRTTYPHASLSVQVGEDAYFVRDNAMGIADGVGGWAKSLDPATPHPTPSALFARRLMHFCSAEIDAASHSSASQSSETSTRPPTSQFSFQHHLRPRTASPAPISRVPGPYDHYTYSELEDSLSASLDDLSDGIDVLQILERAYDSTVKAHMAPTSPNTPLHTGSSTALLAVLDHPPLIDQPLPQCPEAPQRNYAAGSIRVTPESSAPSTTPISHTPLRTSASHPSTIDPVVKAAEILSKSARSRSADGRVFTPELDVVSSAKPFDAVLKIAHLGDCMGMLVRGDEIVWRSDEMWWGYNQPLQLGPPVAGSSSSSSTNTLPVQPHTFTLPVRADDILILASDGLSDNLWDEDVLDEVVRFRRTGGLDGESSLTSSSSSEESLAEAFSTFALDDPKPNGQDGQSNNRLLKRKAFAGMLSEALCSRAKRISETRPSSSSRSSRRGRSTSVAKELRFSVIAEETEGQASEAGIEFVTSEKGKSDKATEDEDEVPFGRRARLAGKNFRGGKHDDISVLVAVISPCHPNPPSPAPQPNIESHL